MALRRSRARRSGGGPRPPRRLIGATALLAACAFLGACGSGVETPAASDQPTESLSIGVTAVGGAQAALWWAEEKGYFDDVGLDVSLQALGSGMTASLVGDRIDLVSYSPGSLLAVANNGRPVKVVYEADTAPTILVSADPAVRSVNDCRTVATGSPGTNARAMTALIQRTFDTQWELIELTDANSFGPTVLSGRAQCGVGPGILYATAMRNGSLHMVLNPNDRASLPASWPAEGGPMQVIGGLAETVTAKGEAIERFAKAYTTALADFKHVPSADQAQTLIAAGGGWESFGPDDLAADIDREKPSLGGPRNGYLTEAAWAATLDYLARGGLGFVSPDDPRWAYGEIVDMSHYEAAVGRP